MIKFFKKSEIIKEKWETCIRSSFQGDLIYAHYDYLSCVAKNWGALVIEENDSYSLVFPFCFKNIVFNKIVYQPFFTQQLGVFSKSEPTPASIKEIEDYLTSNFKEITYSVNTMNSDLNWSFNKTINTNLLLNLNQSYEIIFNNFSSGTKELINKKDKNKIQITESDSVIKTISLFKKELGINIKEITEYHYRVLGNIHLTYKRKNQAKVYEIHGENDELLAGGLFLYDEKRVYNLFTATNKKGKKLGAMSVLYDYLISENIGKREILDFEGSNIEGIATFYKNFGAHSTNYLTLHYDESPSYLRWLRKNF